MPKPIAHALPPFHRLLHLEVLVVQFILRQHAELLHHRADQAVVGGGDIQLQALAQAPAQLEFDQFEVADQGGQVDQGVQGGHDFT